MIRSKMLCSALLLVAAVVSVPAANAQPVVTVKVLAAGSSAMFQAMGVSAYNNLAGANKHHYTVGGNCPSGPCAFIDDTVRGPNIGNEGGNLWVVWDDNNVWAYISVDSVVGVRAFFGARDGEPGGICS